VMTLAMRVYYLYMLSMYGLAVYLNLYVLLPLFFFRKKYWPYSLLIILTIILISLLIILIYSPENIENVENSFRQHLINTVFFVIVTSSLRFIRENLRKQEDITKLEKEKLQAELQNLKNQVNPHFLFNMLNNIYALNLEDHDKANEMILQLADLLRFQFQLAEQKEIYLEEEIKILESYIALEQIRLKEAKVLFEKKGNLNAFLISPMLMLPLVENAFKYGKNEFYFLLEVSDRTLHFSVKNEISVHARKKASAKTGILNLQKRLKLLYPGKHRLEIREEKNFFLVDLQITF